MRYIVSMDANGRREALVRRMRRGAQWSVQALAESVGVSRRTLLRDLAVLRERGYVIHTEAGRGGGVRLQPDRVFVSSPLGADEVVGLMLSLAMMRAAPWMPFARRADSALRKIERALPPQRVRELRAWLGRVLIGEAAGAVHVEAIDDRLLPIFERAFTRRTVLRFAYADRTGRRSERRIEPQAMLVRAPLWYIVAWDLDRSAVRLFRMDRIREPALVEGETFTSRGLQFAAGVCPDAAPQSARRE